MQGVSYESPGFPLKGSFKGDTDIGPYEGYIRLYWGYFGFWGFPLGPLVWALSFFKGI